MDVQCCICDGFSLFCFVCFISICKQRCENMLGNPHHNSSCAKIRKFSKVCSFVNVYDPIQANIDIFETAIRACQSAMGRLTREMSFPLQLYRYVQRRPRIYVARGLLLLVPPTSNHIYPHPVHALLITCYKRIIPRIKL